MTNESGRPVLPEDEYLTADQLIELYGILTEQLNGILGRTTQAVSALTSEQESEADTLDIAVNASNRDFLLKVADRERKMMGRIKVALSRIQEGEYGMCQGCGEEITYGRLLARPVANMCIDCKTEAEQLAPRVSAF